jgi:uncharacterized OB-fold protein
VSAGSPASADVLVANVAGIPVPRLSAGAASYWEGSRAGELRYLRCADCGFLPVLPTPMCPRCRSVRLSWSVSSGLGTLYSWTVVWRPQHPAFAVPYAPAIVRLSEGFTVMSAMVGCAPEVLRDGLAVEVEFHAVDDELTLPFFHPLA